MDAKCVNCNNRANFNIEENVVKCENCGMQIGYEEYIEQMKEKALTLSNDFQYSNDRYGF